MNTPSEGHAVRKYLTLAERRQSILDAALEILNDAGIDAVTMSNLSTRTGVSRQIVYTHFHDIDEVLEALFENVFAEYFLGVEPSDAMLTLQKEQGLLRLEGILDLPLSVHRLVSAAFFCDAHGRPSLKRIQSSLDQLLERNWIAPLTANGFQRCAVASSVYTIVAASLECRDLIDRDMLTLYDAQLQIGRMLDLMLRDPQGNLGEVVESGLQD